MKRWMPANWRRKGMTIGDLLETADREYAAIDRRAREFDDRLLSDLREVGGDAYAELAILGVSADDCGTQIMVVDIDANRCVSRKRTSALSGGEKAMTALALLIAIFRYQPSPFCILDEVDAPLDEANVGRFTKLVSEMSAGTAVHRRHAQPEDDVDGVGALPESRCRTGVSKLVRSAGMSRGRTAATNAA